MQSFIQNLTLLFALNTCELGLLTVADLSAVSNESELPDTGFYIMEVL